MVVDFLNFFENWKWLLFFASTQFHKPGSITIIVKVKFKLLNLSLLESNWLGNSGPASFEDFMESITKQPRRSLPLPPWLCPSPCSPWLCPCLLKHESTVNLTSALDSDWLGKFWSGPGSSGESTPKIFTPASLVMPRPLFSLAISQLTHAWVNSYPYLCTRLWLTWEVLIRYCIIWRGDGVYQGKQSWWSKCRATNKQNDKHRIMRLVLHNDNYQLMCSLTVICKIHICYAPFT